MYKKINESLAETARIFPDGEKLMAIIYQFLSFDENLIYFFYVSQI